MHDQVPVSYQNSAEFLQLLRRKASNGGTAIPFLESKLDSCYAGATGRFMQCLRTESPSWLQQNWANLPRFKAAESALQRIRNKLIGTDLSILPKDVSHSPNARRKVMTQLFYPPPNYDDNGALLPEKDVSEETDEDDDGAQNTPFHVDCMNTTPLNLGDLADNTLKLQSRLTEIELFCDYLRLNVGVFAFDGVESKVVQAAFLSGASSTVAYPFLVKPVMIPFTLPSDILIDMLRTHAFLPLLDEIGQLTLSALSVRMVKQTITAFMLCIV